MSLITLKKETKLILLSLLGGFLFAWGFPLKFMPSIFFASLIGTALFLYSINRQTKFKGRFINFLSFSVTAYLLGYYWIPFTISEFGNIHFPFNHLLGLFFSLIVFPQFLVLICIITISKKISFEKYLNNHIFQTVRIPVYAMGLTLLEYLVPSQFPTHLGLPWMQIAPHLGLAPVFGVPVYSFFSYLLILPLCLKIKRKKEIIFNTCLFFLFIIINIFSTINYLPSNKKNSRSLKIRMVQANIGNFMKISSEKGDHNSLESVHKLYYRMSTQKGSYKPELIIWPETAYPNSIYSQAVLETPENIPIIIRKVMEETEAELFIGGYDINPNYHQKSFEKEYNTAFHFVNDTINNEKLFPRLDNVYHKIKLIPFGETLPFGFLNKKISKFVNNISYFKAGKEYTYFKTKKNLTFSSAICYEILFSKFIRTYLNNLSVNVHFIINLTNDSWYGNTSEPYQHLFASKWRALELNIPIIRMTNTGISSVIFPDGSESARTNLYTSEILDLNITLQNRTATIFQKYGILPLIALCIIQLLFLLLLEWSISLFQSRKPLS